MKYSILNQSLNGIRLALGIALIAAMMPSLVAAQSMDPVTKQKLTDAAKEGKDLTVNTNVSDNVAVEAVLLPEKVCRRVFGKEISQNYATIELIIDNHSTQSSLIVQSIYIDISGWALSRPLATLQSGGGTSAGTQAGDSSKPPASESRPNQQQTYEARNKNSQIGSVEYRVARGDVLDRQNWTARNTFIHTLQLAGTLASAYVFTTTDVDVIRGISSFNGQAIPAFQKFWPDATIEQLNRISDVGFKVNKVIAKDSSDIVVAFFPLDNFLTSSLKKLFFQSPALFFNPGEMAFEPKVLKKLEPLFRSAIGDDTATAEYMKKLPGKILSPQDEKDEKILQLLDKISLNNIKVLAGGVMTVDVTTVPASITSIEIDSGTDDVKSWTSGSHAGTIKGSFLLNGTPELVKPPTGVKVEVVQKGSSDSELHFNLTVPDKFLTTEDQQLTFKVSKNSNAGKTVESMPYELTVPAQGTSENTPAKKEPAK
jgi:hypothetical protein